MAVVAGPTTKSPPRQPRPLKILTIDGGGLQAIATLLILNKLLEAIGKQNCNPPRKPRACDVFDTIAGIGAGGWLAILLGRFRMDITTCLSEWYNITQRIEPKSKSEELRLRLLHHCYFDTERLVGQIDHLTERYSTGPYLVENDPEGARTRHVFVAALKSDATGGYRLFRSYEAKKSANLPEKLLEGPADPQNFRISSAFGVTGAAKYFTKEWKERMSTGGRATFIDSKFPNPHNITELALNEMWGIYGTDVPISVIVNIGPGLPNDLDVKRLAKRFSWGREFKQQVRSPVVQQGRGLNREEAASISQSGKAERHTIGASVGFQENTDRDLSVDPTAKGEHKQSMKRYDTFGSEKDRPMDVKLRRLEHEIEREIKAKLERVHPGSQELYYRLAPSVAPQGTAQNDSSAPVLVQGATTGYLNQSSVSDEIHEISKRCREEAAAAA